MTFLFTDIEGSTTLLQRSGEDAYARALAEHHALIRSALAAHDGTELTMMGDGFFAAFSSPRACVAAVVAMQQALQSHSWPGGEPLRVRMGVHTGEAEQTAAGPVGLDVHRAARICAAVHGVKPARRGGLKVPHRVRLGYGRGFTPSGILRASGSLPRGSSRGTPS